MFLVFQLNLFRFVIQISWHAARAGAWTPPPPPPPRLLVLPEPTMPTRRRDCLQKLLLVPALPSAAVATQLLTPAAAAAAATTAAPAGAAEVSNKPPTVETTTVIVRSSGENPKFQYGCRFDPPPTTRRTGKPLQTHLEEVQFQDPDKPSYQYGLTIDPVRIESLSAFGTPQEVAAKVVLAELNRDGVTNVKLMQDPIEVLSSSSSSSSSLRSTTAAAATATATLNDANVATNPTSPPAYLLNYLSQGKRGDKRFVVKLFIDRNMLYTLTAQCKEADFDPLQREIEAAAASFQVL